MIDTQMQEMVELGRQHDFKESVAVVPFADQLRNDYFVRDYHCVVKSPTDTQTS